eukprot:CAMPEP_0195292912 /NCGR_PEP_ID=MMETSP0707-20130614/11204_1 /TAXON_ID=33640 /ORGANISM="Asterionellopsis glacialis, Strain CCMP134" /LENGTH=687 /DNA_ID=CAMNT_0040353507 /DNA_START=144 /DNA_END=2207 /DNA_ORIENTATION=+
MKRLVVSTFMLFLLMGTTMARPLVRHIRSTHEFERLLHKHATETGLPVIVDFYSDGCGPCRMMAPIFKKLAKEIGQDKAVFVKVDTNAMYELSSKYQIRSLPTFTFFLGGKKVDQFSGAGEQQLRQLTSQVVRQAEFENVKITLEDLTTYYQTMDATKTPEAIETVYQKCVDMTKTKHSKECVGAAANQLGRRLKKKYQTGPPTVPRFSSDAQNPSSSSSSGTDKKSTTDNSKSSKTTTQQPQVANLHLATKEELLAELEQRQDAEVDAAVEDEDDDDAEFQHGWEAGDFPERVTVIGGGPAGLSAAIYAARAGLTPVVVAPPMGGQLQGKGVDVENYPGLEDITGPGVVSKMRDQAIQFGAVFESESVLEIDVSSTPYKVITNSSSSPSIETHSIIVATGAESNWLGIPGEYELRGGGVSSCATCDGALYAGQHVVVVGGGDTAMEDALVLARTSKSVTLVHRRDTFRASNVLAQRVMDHPSIHIQWNTVVTEIKGAPVKVDKKDSGDDDDDGDVDLDNVPSSSPTTDTPQVVSSVVLKNVDTQEETTLSCHAVFVAIGHTPTTSFLEGIVEFDEDHPGYVKTEGKSTRTSVPGIFAAGDVSDAVYRQAITSAGSGAAAALDAERWLSEEGLGNEAAEFEAELLAELLQDTTPLGGGAAGGDETYNVYDSAGGRMEGMKESLGAEL